ncbi:unnamed protein product [Rhizoctonia solani]|uniref:Uncharacterized protein n=1 Tax=Rhizoctonia solani TaxID=456999 RepID=A0A8H3BJ03_9AGAM|nr:unnamed protein product [Rhizoctonia solani]
MFSEFETLVHDTFVSQCVSIAALTLLFYDHLITFADVGSLDMARKIWAGQSYFLSQPIRRIDLDRCSIYRPLWFRHFSFSFGEPFFRRPGHVLINLVMEAMSWLDYREYLHGSNQYSNVELVYDIWQSQRLAFFVLAPFWLIHFILDFLIVTNHTIKNYARYGYLQTANVCTANPGNLWTLCLNGIIYHVLILLLLMWIWLSTPRTAQTPFVRLVLRDGFIYFITIISVMLFNLLVWRYARPSLVLLPYTLTWVILNGALSRTLLSLGSVQTSEEWGQRANLTIIPPDIELGRVLSGGTISTYRSKDEDAGTVNSVRRTSRVVKLII